MLRDVDAEFLYDELDDVWGENLGSGTPAHGF